MTDAVQAQPSVMDCAEIYYAPSAVFERRRGGEFLVPWIVFVVAFVALFMLTKPLLQPLMDAETARMIAAQRRANPNITEEQVSAMRSAAQGFATVGVAISGLLLPLISGVILWLVAKLVTGAVGLKQAVMIGVFGMFPLLLGQVVSAIQGAMMDVSGATSRYALSIGPARFVGTDQPVLLAILGQFDLFAIWIAVLLAIGVKVIGRVSTGQAAVVGVVMWLVGLIFPLLGALRSAPAA